MDSLLTNWHEFDEPMGLERDTRALTPEKRAWWEEAVGRGPGWPAKPDDEKVRRVLISLDPDRLARIDAEKERRNTSRSALISEAMREMLGK